MLPPTPLRLTAAVLALSLLAVLGCSPHAPVPRDLETYSRLPSSIRADTAETDLVSSVMQSHVEDDLGQAIVLVDAAIVLDGDYASVRGRPMTAVGDEIDFARIPKYADAKKHEAFDPTAVALLKRTDGDWQVLEYELGATDFAGDEWIRRNAAPNDIFDSD